MEFPLYQAGGKFLNMESLVTPAASIYLYLAVMKIYTSYRFDLNVFLIRIRFSQEHQNFFKRQIRHTTK